MANNIIYKGSKNGTQVDFTTGSLTDISTFTGDVRGAAIQNQIVDGVTGIGASQDAIHAMSGYLAANAHPVVTPAGNTGLDLSDGNVIQDITFEFDSDGHVTTATFDSVNLDDRYFTEAEVTGISGDLQSQITGNDAELATLRTATGFLENEIDALQEASGNYLSLTLDDVAQIGSATSAEIEVGSLRVSGDGNSASITGPATITIDPDSAGAAGTVVIAGDLQVDGTTTTINSTSVQIDDFSLVLGTGAPNNESADGAGIIVDGTGALTIAEFTYDGAADRWTTDGLDIEANIVGTATSAEAWTTDRTITLDGDLGGSTSINGSSNVTLTATIENGAVENDMLAGSIANSKLSNSSVSYGGVALSLGGSDATPAFDLSDATNYPTTALVGTITNAQLAGSIENSKLTNSSVNYGGVSLSLGGSDTTPAFDLSDATNYPTTALVGTITNDQLAGSIANSKLVSDSVNFGGVTVALGSSDATPAFDLSDATNYPTTALVGTITNAQLAGSIENSKLANSSITLSVGNGLSGGSTASLGGSFGYSTKSDQGHLDEIELGSDNSAETNVVTKGGIIILRGTDNDGITTSGDDGNAIDLNDKTTVAFEGVVQSARTDQDSDNGSYVAMWKIQGVIRRDADSTNMLQSFVTKTFAGANASAYGLSVSVNGIGLKINSDQNTANLITSATINYNWIEDTTA